MKTMRSAEETGRLARELWRAEMEELRQTAQATAHGAVEAFCSLLSILEHSVRREGKILLFGNGGSAADAQHIAAELVVRYRSNRAPIAAVALTSDTSTLTACANDLGYDRIFERQIEAIGRKGDVAFAISTSGRSANVLNGLRRARDMGLHTVGLSGSTGGAMGELCDSVVLVPSSVTARIQEMHIAIGHMLSKALEEHLGLM